MGILPLSSVLSFLLLLTFQFHVCFTMLDPDVSDFEANNNLKMKFSTANSTAPPSPCQFSHYIFAVEWLASICSQPSHKFRCKADLKIKFNIRGLWPAYEDGSYLEYCIDKNIIPPYSTYENENRALWAYNWHKHGTCSGLGQLQYLKAAVDLYKKVDVMQRFVQLGIIPDAQKTYNPSRMISEFYEKYKVGIKVVCVKKSPYSEMIGEIHFKVKKMPQRSSRLMKEMRSGVKPPKFSSLINISIIE